MVRSGYNFPSPKFNHITFIRVVRFSLEIDFNIYIKINIATYTINENALLQKYY